MATVNAKVLSYKKIRELHFIGEIPVSNAARSLNENSATASPSSGSGYYLAE